jgi:hypothetical protein
MHPMLRRLDDLGAHLATRGDVVALLGLGSAGTEHDRMDEPPQSGSCSPFRPPDDEAVRPPLVSWVGEVGDFRVKAEFVRIWW